MEKSMSKEARTKDWLLRFVKGMFIGSGFILPGVSGGALAAIFGIYERIISFKYMRTGSLILTPVGADKSSCLAASAFFSLLFKL